MPRDEAEPAYGLCKRGRRDDWITITPEGPPGVPAGGVGICPCIADVPSAGASQRRLRDGTYDRFSERWAWICASTVFRAPLLSTLCAVELPVVVHGGDALARFRGGHVEQLGGLQSCFAACVSATGRLAAHAGVLPLGEEAPKSSCAVADESAGVAPSMSLGGWRVLRDVIPLGWPPSGR